MSFVITIKTDTGITHAIAGELTLDATLNRIYDDHANVPYGVTVMRAA